MCRAALFTLIGFCIIQGRVLGISLNELLPYGVASGDAALDSTAEDGNSVEARLTVPITFYLRQYYSLFVNENGMISFLTEVPSFYNVEMPMDYPIIAPFYADFDLRGSGQVYWRVSNQRQDLTTISRIVNQYFSDEIFETQEAVIVTWDQAGRFNSNQDKVNTLQCIIATDGKNAFSIFLYPDTGIQWVKGEGKNRNSPDARAQVGFMSGEGRHLLLPMSGKDQVNNIHKWSNTDKPGLWVFKIGKLDTLQNIQGPATQSAFDPSTADSCEVGAAMCHSQGACVDTAAGFCCSCNLGWYGNGETCLENKQAQRVNGRVNGVINGVSILEQDLHSFVVTVDGRTYTAISRVGSDVGWDLQGLVPLGTAIAWLFAVPRDEGSLNGFSLTGGILNYTAEVYYPDTGHKASIEFRIKGMNVFDYLTADVTINGNVPSIPEQGKISVEDNEIEFTRIQPGMVRARSEHKFKIEGKNMVVPYTVEHVARWDECIGSLDMARITMKMISTRSFIIYNEQEEIVRYAMASHVSRLEAAEDPCQQVDCGEHSRCLVEGLQHRCICLDGYGDTGQGYCEDIDECLDISVNNCHQDAQCTNQAGGFECSCKFGFVGDGTTCIAEVKCADLQCDEVAGECFVNPLGQGECRCRTGYKGDGYTCTVLPSKVKLRGFSDPEVGVVRSSAAKAASGTASGLGQSVRHTFEVTNYGPFDVGHVVVNVSWPLKDANGNWLLYLYETPFIQYSKDTRYIKEDCEIDPSVVNALNLKQLRRKRQALDYDDEDDFVYDGQGGTGFMMDPDEMDYAFSEETLGLGTVYDEEFDAYDYSHLIEALTTTEAPAGGRPATTTTTTKPFATFADLSSDRVVEKPMSQPVAAPIYGENGDYGRINFLCKVSLTTNEAGIINVISYLHHQSLMDNYRGVTKFAMESTAEILDSLLVEASEEVAVTTLLDVADPVFDQGPGQGIMCGYVECHKYAVCVMVFAASKESGARCQCPSGFSGDGVNECEPPGIPVSQTCGTGPTCGENAQCQEVGGRMRCECDAGYTGDGYLCAVEHYGEAFWTQDPSSPVEVRVPIESPPAPVEAPSPSVGAPPPQASMEPECVFGVCSCPVPGFSFDGTNCVKEVEPAATCRSNQECAEGLVCQYNSEVRRYECVVLKLQDQCQQDEECGNHGLCKYSGVSRIFECSCHPGYIKRRSGCRLDPLAGCDTLKNCDKNADCVMDRVLRRYFCSCQAGYTGNGTSCEVEPVIGCNVLNNCHKFAECQYNPVQNTHRCVCDSARGFTGDGISCSPVACIDNPVVCDPNADCMYTNKDHHGCRCKSNFFGDGLSCEPVPRFEGNYLLLTQGMALIRVPFSGKGSKPININSQQLATGIDIDCSRGQIYFTDTRNKVVTRTRMDGTQAETFVAEDWGFPEGIAVDWVSRNLYVTDPGRDCIDVISLDNKMRIKLIEDGIHSPRGIAVHPGIGKLYWTDWDRYEPSIEMSNMDGTQRQVLVSSGLGEPNSITVDYANYEVCWADGGRREKNIKPKIDCIGANGSGRRTVIELSEGEYPYGLVITQNSILWTDWNKKNVHSADKTTGMRQRSIPYTLAGLSKAYGIVNVPEECPYLTNTCQGEPCGLYRMCLPNGNGGHTCK